MRFEDILHEIGGFNKFQFSGSIYPMASTHHPPAALPAPQLHLRCATPHCALPHLDDRYIAGTKDSAEVSAQILALGIPRNADGSYSSCKMYPLPLDFDPNADLSLVYGNRSNVSCHANMDGYMTAHSSPQQPQLR